jgi:hypothetical protein
VIIGLTEEGGTLNSRFAISIFHMTMILRDEMCGYHFTGCASGIAGGSCMTSSNVWTLLVKESLLLWPAILANQRVEILRVLRSFLSVRFP